MTIVIGWWIIPALITIEVYAVAWMHQDRNTHSDYGKIGAAMGNALLMCMATIVSLLAWLIWAVLYTFSV